jgi:hypothetical protein
LGPPRGTPLTRRIQAQPSVFALESSMFMLEKVRGALETEIFTSKQEILAREK